MIKKSLINLEPVRDAVRRALINKYDSTTYMNTSVIDLRLDVKEILDKYVEEQHLVEPKVYITTDAYCKMRKLVDDTTTEIGWYGIVHKMEALEATYIIEDIIVYPQTVSGATCTQDDDKIFQFELSLTTDQVNHKRFHGHSHVNMGTTPSGVDEGFYQDLLTQVNDYFIIIVTNKRGDVTSRFYDMEHNLLYSDIPLNVIANDGTALDTWYDTATAELSDKIYASAPITGGANFQGSVFDDEYSSYYDDYVPWWDKKKEKEEKRKVGRPKKHGK